MCVCFLWASYHMISNRFSYGMDEKKIREGSLWCANTLWREDLFFLKVRYFLSLVQYGTRPNGKNDCFRNRMFVLDQMNWAFLT